MLKAKFFTSRLANSDSFEDQINNFFVENPTIQIVDLKYNCNMVPKDENHDGIYTALLIYRETPEKTTATA